MLVCQRVGEWFGPQCPGAEDQRDEAEETEAVIGAGGPVAQCVRNFVEGHLGAKGSQSYVVGLSSFL